MDGIQKMILFYFVNYNLEIKDIESEVYTDSRVQMHFCMFHNKDLHFSKSEILKKTLVKKFENISPEFHYENGKMVMTKYLPDFNTDEFDKFVDVEYNDYLYRINYRIDCIFQTISLFLNIYKDKNVVFILPIQLISHFEKESDNQKMMYSEITGSLDIIKKWDILTWINYYLKKDSVNFKEEIKVENIIKILKFEGTRI
jgi:hypothetical protein